MARQVPGPWPADEMRRFLDTFFYDERAFLIDEIVSVDREAARIVATLDTTGPLPFAAAQRTHAHHPAHVAAPELLMATGCLGSLHAWLFHGCRWDEGWAGFGNRIHRADFKALARLGPPLSLVSQELKTRVGPRRVMMRLSFEFSQEGRLIYVGDQSAIFVKERRDL